MRSSCCEENSFPSKEDFAENTRVFTKSMTMNGEELASKNQFGLSLYSTDLTADAAGLLRGEAAVAYKEKRLHRLAQPLLLPLTGTAGEGIFALEKKIRNPV